MANTKIRNILLTSFTCLAVLAILFKVEIPGYNMLWREIGNAGHIPLFGILAMAILFLSKTLFGGYLSNLKWHYIMALVITSGLGFLTEFIQWFTPRDADFLDIVRDVLGAIIFLSFFILAREKKAVFFNGQKWFRVTLGFTIIILLLVGLSPVLVWTGAYAYRSANIPNLCGFESPVDLLFVRMSRADLKRVTAPVSWQTKKDSTVAQITYHPAEFSEMYFRDPYPDWLEFSRFGLEIYSPEDTAIQLTIRIDDRYHSGDYRDRFNRTVTVLPGDNRIIINCEEIVNGPELRKLDISRIKSVIVFSHKIPRPITVYVDNIFLE